MSTILDKWLTSWGWIAVGIQVSKLFCSGSQVLSMLVEVLWSSCGFATYERNYLVETLLPHPLLVCQNLPIPFSGGFWTFRYIFDMKYMF